MSSSNDPYLVTTDGSKFFLERPEEFTFDIFQIASSLSKQCRFAGNCRTFYSVAHHSVLVSHIAPTSHQLEALLHDASEALLGDVTAPLKGFLPQYIELENRAQAAINRQFGVETCTPEGLISPQVHRADMEALALEKRDLMPPDPEQWQCLAGIEARGPAIKPWDPDRSAWEFVNRYNQLTK